MEIVAVGTTNAIEGDSIKGEPLQPKNGLKKEDIAKCMKRIKELHPLQDESLENIFPYIYSLTGICRKCCKKERKVN